MRGTRGECGANDDRRNKSFRHPWGKKKHQTGGKMSRVDHNSHYWKQKEGGEKPFADQSNLENIQSLEG